MERIAFLLAATNGLLAVALGAFGAHGLKRVLVEDAAVRMEWWQTASQYHLVHALALGMAGYLAGRTSDGATTVAIWAFTAGIVLFSGSLYVMTLTGIRPLGAVTPIGGLGLLVGWGALIMTAWRMN